MERKIKIITAACIGAIGVIGGCTYFLGNQNKEINDNPSPSTQNPTTNQKDDIKDEVNNSNNSNLNQKVETPDANNSNSGTILKPIQNPSLKPSDTGSNQIINNPIPGTPSIETPREEEPIVVPPKPEEPPIPSEEEKVEDLIITNDMLQDGTYTISNKKYNSITISSDIDSNSKIVLDTIETTDGLILIEPNNYQLDVINSNISSLITKKRVLRTFSVRKVAFNSINKSLEGATINLQNSTVKTATINNNVEINGATTIQNVTINDANEVVLNVPVQNVILKTSGLVAINQDVDMLTNANADSTVVINSSVNTFMNNSKSAIHINNNNLINNFYNLGENTIVSGTGSIKSAVISASNTRIYSQVIEQPILEGENDNILIRSENQNNIESVTSTAQGIVTFTLKEAVDLTIKDISVICNAGKNITLYNLTTTDKKTYTLTTSYFKNNSYALYLTLPNGNIISKDFDTDYANPTVNKVVVERTSDTLATFELYGVDEGGNVYYILEDAETREIINSNYIKEHGQKANVKVGYNIINLDNLEPNKSYNLYYAIEGYFGNLSKEQGPFNIASDVVSKDTNNYQIVSAKEEMANRFVFTLNKVPDKKLSLNDFEIICPTEKNLTINGATFITSPDLLTYIIIVPDNYGHKDNKYTVKVQISDNEKIESTFVSHFAPPVITGAVDNITRIDENTANFNFNSDEEGIVYYGIYDWNGGIYDYNTTTPFASDIIENVKKGDESIKHQNLNAGPNTITLDLTGYNVTKNTQVWALFVDYAGNYRVGFVDHYKIPEYTKPDIPEIPDSSLQITNFKVTNNNYIVIDFNELIGWVSSEDIELSVISGGSLPAKLLYSIDNDTPQKLSINILNYTLPTGEYELKLHVLDQSEKSVTLKETIVIN